LIPKIIRKFEYLIDRVSHFLLVLSGILVLLMAWIVTYGVIKRYAFHAPDPYTYELSTMFLLFCGVLAVAAVEKMDRHVRNDILSSRFPESVQLILLRITFPFFALLFVVILTWKSWSNALYALRIGQVSASPWAVPLAPIKFVIPLGYGLLCLVLIGKFCHGLAQFRKTKNRIGDDEDPGF
jgi:TRAP-type mannitol/chloroaromatic compound transport system permease small subunit